MVTLAERSEVAICNMALSACKAGSITDLADRNSVKARECRRHYPVVRDRLLKQYRWNCNTRRVTLTPAEAPLFGFEKAYIKPPDALRILELQDATDSEWTVEGDKVLTDRGPTVNAKILIRETNPAKFDEDLIELMSLELAVAIAPKVAARRRMAGDAATRLVDLRNNAKAVDAKEGRENFLEVRTTYVSVRNV